MRIEKLILLPIVIILSGCPPSPHPYKNATCEIVPPASFGTQDDTSKRKEAQVQLSNFGKANVVSDDNFHSAVNKTYQTLEDKDVACSMLLKTLTCLSSNGVEKSRIIDFQEYLKTTQSCERVDSANISIDSLVQLNQSSWGNRKKSIILDLFVRNSGDQPATVTNTILRFDEQQRPSRAPADILKVSGVYVLTVDGKGATVSGPDLNSAATAFYPGPGVNSLIVNTPVSQSLNPRTLDRFRIQIDFLEDADIRGSMDSVRAEVIYNDGKTASSKVITLRK